jgi:hypothetical protein
MNLVKINCLTIDMDSVGSYLVVKDLDSWEDDHGKGKVIKFIPKQRITKDDYSWARFETEEERAAVADWLDKQFNAYIVKVVRETPVQKFQLQVNRGIV